MASIVHLHGDAAAEARLEAVLHRRSACAEEVRGELEHALAVDEPGDSYPHRGHLGLGGSGHGGNARADQLLAQLGDVVEEGLSIVQRPPALLGDDGAILVDGDPEDLCAADVDPDRHSVLGVGRLHASDSTAPAFRSLIAAWRMLPSARRLMKPGRGTRSSTAS